MITIYLVIRNSGIRYHMTLEVRKQSISIFKGWLKISTFNIVFSSLSIYLTLTTQKR